VNVKEAFKINKDKMMLAKIESWEQKKNIILNKSNLKERKGKRMYSYIDDDLTNEERKIQKKLREMDREEKDRGKRLKIEYRKIQLNGEWFIWDEGEDKLKKIFRRRREEEKTTRRGKVQEKVNKKVDGQRKRKTEKKYKGEHKRKDRKERGEAKVRVLYRNVAGLNKKGEEFWDYVR
jgi:hypothetical protein